MPQDQPEVSADRPRPDVVELVVEVRARLMGSDGQHGKVVTLGGGMKRVPVHGLDHRLLEPYAIQLGARTTELIERGLPQCLDLKALRLLEPSS